MTALINTSSGQLDPATSWATGERMAGVGRAVGAMAGFNVMAFLVLLFVVAVAAIGSRVPALAFALIAAAVCSAVWWHRRDRTRA